MIQICTISDLESQPHIHEMLDEYAQESAIHGLPHPKVNIETYRALEKVGAIHILGAFLEEKLIGFFVVLSPVLPHFGVKVAVAESFFVSKEHRKTGAGLKLLKAAEAYAMAVGSCGLLVSAPMNGILSEILPNVGYNETSRVFFRSFTNE